MIYNRANAFFNYGASGNLIFAAHPCTIAKCRNREAVLTIELTIELMLTNPVEFDKKEIHP